jgi:hypothetical protein
MVNVGNDREIAGLGGDRHSSAEENNETGHGAYERPNAL